MERKTSINERGRNMEHFIKMCGSFREELAKADDETLWRMIADITLVLNQPGHEISKNNRLFLCWYSLLCEVRNTADYRLDNMLKGDE